jgi:hypothetical protein
MQLDHAANAANYVRGPTLGPRVIGVEYIEAPYMVSATLENEADPTLENEAIGSLASSLPCLGFRCWAGCRSRGCVVGSWRPSV